MATGGNNSFGSDDGAARPKLFSMTRALLETRRGERENSGIFNRPLAIPSAHERPGLPAQQRQPLISIFGNAARTSTPVQQQRGKAATPAFYDEDTYNRGSSPSFSSSASPDRAYMQPNQTVSASPLGQNILEPRPTRSASKSGESFLSAADTSQTSAKWEDALSYVRGLESLVTAGKGDVERLNLMQSQSSRDLVDFRVRLNLATEELQAAKNEINTLRATLDTSKEGLSVKDGELLSLQASLSQVKQELASSVAENGRLKEDIWTGRAETENIRKVLERSKQSIATISSEYSILGSSLKELKQAHDVAHEQLHEMWSEVQALRKTTKNTTSALELMLDDNNTSARAADTRALLKQLQVDLTGSHEVTDILRNKLLHNASQLADAQNRVRELEEEKRGSLRDLVAAHEDERRKFESLAEVEKHIAELSVRLAAREKETIDTLANAASVEMELKAVKQEFSFYQNVNTAQNEELELLRTLKDQNVSKLLELQDGINLRDKEIISLRSEVKALEDSRAEQRELMAEAKKSLAEKEMALKAKDPNDECQIEIGGLRSENLALKTANHEIERALKAANKASQSAVQHFNKTLHELDKLVVEVRSKNGMLQTALDKSQGDIKLALSRASVADGKALVLQDDLHMVKKHSESLMAEIAALKERLEVQSMNLYQSKGECAKLKERMEQYIAQKSAFLRQLDDKSSLAEALEKQAALAQSNAALAHTYLTQTSKDYQGKIAELTAQLASMKEASLLRAKMTTTELEQEMDKLRDKLAILEKLNSDLVNRAENIKLRYSEADLTDAERHFVGHLVCEAQNMHEEEVVLKNNELRRRQNMIETLNCKVTELQGTLARLLMEKGGAPGASNKAMVDLKMFMSLSPEKSAEEAPSVSNEDQAMEALLLDTVSSHRQDPNSSRFQDIDADESEDDIPLSELGQFPTDEPEPLAAKRARSPSPPVVEEPSRPKRRTKNSNAAEKVASPSKSLVVQKKGGSSAKPKPKKRKDKKAAGDT